ncbi:MAG: hypothetical protein HUJ51_00485 [Eggerthellaceae bacterium]|nr:hypothetical protein [Eggerthellaceae bacterium]
MANTSFDLSVEIFVSAGCIKDVCYILYIELKHRLVYDLGNGAFVEKNSRYLHKDAAAIKEISGQIVENLCSVVTEWVGIGKDVSVI